MQQKLTGAWGKDLLLLTLLLGSLFTYLLGNHALSTPDEARYCEIAREMLVTHDFLTPHVNGIKYFEKPPLLYWLQAASLHYLGFSESACRTLNTLLGLLGCLITYATARLLYNRRTGWLAAIILGTSLLYFILARTVTLDMSVTFFLMATLYALLLALQHSPTDHWRRSLFYIAYGCAALTVLTKGLIGLIFPGAIVLIWLAMTRRWLELKHSYLVSGTLLFLIIALPWHILLQRTHPEFFNYYFIQQQFVRYFTNAQHRYQPLWFDPLVLLLGFFPWTGFLYGAFIKNDRNNPITLFLMIWSIFILLFFTFSHSNLVPYLLPCFPPLAILVAHYIDHEEQQSTTRAGWIGFNTIILLSIGFIIAAIVGLTPAVTDNYLFVHRWSHIIIGILILNSFTLPFVYRKFGFISTFGIQVIFTMLFFASASAALSGIALRSIKPLAMTIKPLLSPTVMIASYDYYYQDLPFYLQRNISIVNWRGELAFGTDHQSSPSLAMINSALLWQHWQSPQTVYLFLPQKIWQNLVKPLPHHFYQVTANQDDIVLTNHLRTPT